MNAFEVLLRWMNRSHRRAETNPSPNLPPRPQVLLQPEVDESIRLRMRSSVAEDYADNGHERYRVRPSPEGGGPRWDPYDENQSRAARVQAARRTRPRPEGPVVYDRWSVTPESKPKLTHYQLLGVQTDATIQQIERAYRRYAASIHPDKFFDDPKARKQAEGKLRELNAVMQILRDPYKRAEYDLTI